MIFKKFLLFFFTAFTLTSFADVSLDNSATDQEQSADKDGIETFLSSKKGEKALQHWGRYLIKQNALSQLFDGILVNDASAVKEALKKCNINDVIEMEGHRYHLTPLLAACLFGRNEIVSFLLERGANPYAVIVRSHLTQEEAELLKNFPKDKAEVLQNFCKYFPESAPITFQGFSAFHAAAMQPAMFKGSETLIDEEVKLKTIELLLAAVKKNQKLGFFQKVSDFILRKKNDDVAYIPLVSYDPLAQFASDIPSSPAEVAKRAQYEKMAAMLEKLENEFKPESLNNFRIPFLNQFAAYSITSNESNPSNIPYHWNISGEFRKETDTQVA